MNTRCIIGIGIVQFPVLGRVLGTYYLARFCVDISWQGYGYILGKVMGTY